MEDEVLSVTEAARVSGLSRWTLYRKIADGTLPSFSRAVNKRKVYVRRSDLDRLFAPVRRSTPAARVEVER